MGLFNSKLTLPVSVTTGGSGSCKKNGLVITETFSEEFKGLLSNTVLIELGTIFDNCGFKGETTAFRTNKAVTLLCKFMINYNITSLDQMCSGDLSMLMDFIKRETPETNEWNTLFSALRSHKHNTSLAHIFWPKCVIGRTSNTTEGHSLFAYNQIGVDLCKEIDRIREKNGRFAEAMKSGRVITPAELAFVYENRPQKHCSYTDDPLADLSVTKEDLICTLIHYLPGWPVLNRSNARFIRWGVYQDNRGIRLQCFETKEEADALSKKLGGTVFVALISNIDTMNPAEIILNAFINFQGLNLIKRHLLTVISGLLEIVEFYYPTGYDLGCVYLYWLWLTGWNNETIASVSAIDLNLGVEVGKKCPIIEVIAPEHTEIKGTPPANRTPARWRDKPSIAPGLPPDLIKGVKVRSQPEDKPKPYNYICDKNNPYDLYKVLHDYYELTKPLRCFLSQEEKGCILVGVSSSGGTSRGDSRNIAIYGAPLHCKPLDYKENGLGRFFTRHAIYDDMNEFLDGVRGGKNCAPDDPASFPERYTRVFKTDARKMRTTYHDWLQANGVPLFVRQAKMGHENDRTTTTSYGADLVSIGIRKRQLRAALIEIERMASEGQLQPYSSSNARQKKDENKVVQIFSHLSTCVFICQNPKKPSWDGFEEYFTGCCTEFDECLFCEQCLIIPDSLPVLVRWHRNITDMPELVGPIGMIDKTLRRLQAIDEVFDLCREGGPEWQVALENAYEIEMDPAFTAPDAMYRYTREG